MSKTLEYNNYPLTYNGNELEFDNIQGENSGVYLAIPGSLELFKLSKKNKTPIIITESYEEAQSWVANDGENSFIVFTLSETPEIGDDVYGSSIILGQTTYKKIGKISKPGIIVFSSIEITGRTISGGIYYKNGSTNNGSLWKNTEGSDIYTHTPDSNIVENETQVYSTEGGSGILGKIIKYTPANY